ncbi:MAG: hypothetical protein IK052_01490 [Bacteroidales bacterium]|nr:hypothetical protein [Bacteroidales bacterium]
MRKSLSAALCIIAFIALTGGCGSTTKIQKVETEQLQAHLALSRGEIAEERKVIASAPRDTITVTGENGETLLLMKAVKDEESGEMVAHDVINAAVITARFRNVAERHGRVDLRFEVIVPEEMMDTRWQLQFYPDMFILEDSVRLEPVIITGSEFRSRQLRGYELYDKYLRSIITDTTAFIDWRNLNIWIARNLPELYKYKTDSSFVSETAFHSLFGPTEADAIRHYTFWHRRYYHERRWHQRGEKFQELVKAPILTEGIRLDTVLRDIDGNFVYQYTQSIRTRPRLRKVDIVLSGDIFEQEKHLYTMPRSEPLTFYISSLSAFVDTRERYLSRVLERKAAANTACYVDFAQGSSSIDLSLGHNATEMGRIRGNILELLQNTTYDLDSIVISASASPEGTVRSNGELALKRAAAVASYFDSFIRHWRDSVQRNSFSVNVDDAGEESIGHNIPASIPFLSRSSGENWPYLGVLVDEDTVMTSTDKLLFIKHLETADVDERERGMQAESWYRYMRENLYPRLRTVRFDFFLHRKGMVKDTVHTTELDTLYMRGVRLLQEREYEKALTCLRDYRDYNTAIAYVSLDYNASAMAILSELPKTPQVSYMLALLYARAGDDSKAVENYLRACREDRSYVFRGNLDPEIFILIQRYGLNREEDTF